MDTTPSTPPASTTAAANEQHEQHEQHEQQRPAPHHGEHAADLIYDAQAGAWIYPASYDDVTLARRRAAGLADGWGIPFAVALFGVGGESWEVADNPSIAIAIPGYYAFTTHDPRPQVIVLPAAYSLLSGSDDSEEGQR